MNYTGISPVSKNEIGVNHLQFFYSYDEWVEYNKFVGTFSWSILGASKIGNITVPANICNVNGIGCKKEPDGPIDYSGSDFDSLSEYIKQYYIHIKNLFLENKRDKIIKFPSFTDAFQPNDDIQFLPYYLIFDNVLVSKLGDENNLQFFNDVYSGVYDTALEDILLLQEYATSNKNKNHIKDYGIERIQYIHENTIDTILIGTKNTVFCSLNQIYNSINTQFHTIVSVFWREPGSNNITCGVYDPIYFYRKETGKNYFFALLSFYINMKMLAKIKGVPIQIINLSEYCYTSAKGIHCPQYIINAEYCNIYSVYFIYRYMLRGYPRTEDGLREVIRDCFIVEPSELGRNVSIPNNIFRITMMSFILTLLVLVTINPVFYNIRRDGNVKQQILQMISIHNRVKAAGFSLLQPKLENILLSLKEFTGGRRSHKSLRKTKRKHKYARRTRIKRRN